MQLINSNGASSRSDRSFSLVILFSSDSCDFCFVDVGIPLALVLDPTPALVVWIVFCLTAVARGPPRGGLLEVKKKKRINIGAEIAAFFKTAFDAIWHPGEAFGRFWTRLGSILEPRARHAILAKNGTAL